MSNNNNRSLTEEQLSACFADFESKIITKEQLFSCLESDKVEVDALIIEKARNNDGVALCSIGYVYYDKLKNYSKAMAWYRLAANQNNLYGTYSVGALYANGQGVPQDRHIAMEYYLKAAGHKFARDNVGEMFLVGLGVRVDKYKALEWFIKSGIKPEKVEKLKKEGIALKEEDKDKTIYQLVNETEDILREERRKKEYKLKNENLELKRIKLSNEKALANIRGENQKLKNENRKLALHEKERQKYLDEGKLLKTSNDNLAQQLENKDEIIKSLKREIESSKKTTETFELLIQSKNNEIDLLKQIQGHGNLEVEFRVLKRKLEELQGTISVIENNVTTDSNDDAPNNQCQHANVSNDTVNTISVKVEESELPSRQNAAKKRKTS